MHKKGFTLVELLIVLAVFATTTVMASSIFVSSSKAQKKVAEIQRIQGDARYTFEALVREIRSSRIDYDYYEDPDGKPGPRDKINLDIPLGIESNGWSRNPNIALALVRADNTKMMVRVQDEDCLTAPCLVINNQDTGGQWVPITPQGIAVKKMVFVIRPIINPYILSGPTTQPIVTMQLMTETQGGKAEEMARTTYQTSVMTRQYVK